MSIEFEITYFRRVFFFIGNVLVIVYFTVFIKVSCDFDFNVVNEMIPKTAY